jgi:hypothetical protein
MRKIREALRLEHALGLSERQIAVSVGVSRSTVAELRRAGVVGITWPVLWSWSGACSRRRRSRPHRWGRPAEGRWSEALPEWIGAHVNAFTRSGACPIRGPSRMAIGRQACS